MNQILGEIGLVVVEPGFWALVFIYNFTSMCIAIAEAHMGSACLSLLLLITSAVFYLLTRGY